MDNALAQAKHLASVAVATKNLEQKTVESFSDKDFLAFASGVVAQSEALGTDPATLLSNSKGLVMENPIRAFVEAFGEDADWNKLPGMTWMAERVDRHIEILKQLRAGLADSLKNLDGYIDHLAEDKRPWSQKQYKAFELNTEGHSSLLNRLAQISTMVDIGLTYRHALHLFLIAPTDTQAEKILSAFAGRGTPEQFQAMRELRKHPALKAVPTQAQ